MRRSVMICRWAAAAAAMSLMLTAGAANAAAPAKERDVMKNVGSYLQWNSPVTVKLDGKELPVQGEMVDSRILVPFRTVFEALGAKVTWDGASGTASASAEAGGGTRTVVVRPGEEEIGIDGIAYTYDIPAVNRGGSLLVPVRAIPAALGTGFGWDLASRTLTLESVPPGRSGFTAGSPAFGAYGDMPARFAHGASADGRDVNPPLQWEGAPQGTKSFAVVMYDLHPIADNWIHWSVLNLPASSRGLEEGVAGAIREGEETNPYFGMGPPPHSGDHPYRIVVYALDTEKVELPAAPVFFEDLDPALKEHALARAEWTGYFRGAE
ncbi:MULTISPECIES: YbhB/YbcL family Raf kinase inhibitor-like protein [Paenibacillus]|uniref:YbhB/YbcL family Raf kinase inhibitor-like protein n=1 Tax=Paenibacillus TaxID=44249 RepID=UPI0022B88E35|nr:YbhB/YbcL family Raf kinase inhibitor-like protein [Paenibacillus caseinilyticus]MCZ8519925.1 YbhB/YbcL family Raf kinase inhibitor-like protein [Paenibacillus caseinilyticus]